jgi:hypothetical protein
MMADKNENAAGTATDEAEVASEAPDYQRGAAPPARDSDWEQAEKPRLSDEKRIQGLEPEQLRRIMYDMLLGRRFEEKAAEAYALGKIGGFCHLYIGQEAVAVGAIHALRKDDYVMTAYREHVHALQCGIEPGAVMAELYGRATAAPRARAAPCTCSAPSTTTWAATASWAARCRWRWASPGRSSTARKTASCRSTWARRR